MYENVIKYLRTVFHRLERYCVSSCSLFLSYPFLNKGSRFANVFPLKPYRFLKEKRKSLVAIFGMVCEIWMRRICKVEEYE